MRLFGFGLCLAFLAVLSCAAADLTGKWVGEMDHPMGKVQVKYSFQQGGDKLTGTMQAGQSPLMPISEGKVDAKSVSFTVKPKAEGGLAFVHEGSVTSADEIQLKLKPSGEFPGTAMAIKRVKE
jgi:hypothetical protein